MLIEHAPPTTRAGIPRWVWIVCLCVVAAVLAGVILLATHWPFREGEITRALSNASGTKVTAQSFHRTYFPPGCVAENLRFMRANNALITVRKLVIKGSYTGMITVPQRIDKVTVIGMRLTVPPKGTSKEDGGGPIELNSGEGGKSLVISEIVADGALLQFMPENRGDKPFELKVERLGLNKIGSGQPMEYRTTLLNTEPPGEIRSEGKFGPWNPRNAGATPVSGSYTYTGVNLGVFKGITGIAAAHGTFKGPLGRIETDGVTEIPDFHVSGSSHTLSLRVDYHAIVNGTNGDTSLQPVRAHFLRTEVIARGSVAGGSGEEGKTVKLSLAVPSGRIDDLLRLFVSDRTPPMSGTVKLTADFVWPPGPRKFLEKIRMDGRFGLASGRFQSESLQGGIDKISESAQGESKKEEKDDPRTVLSNLAGAFTLRGGVARFSHATFQVPGADAIIAGTYNLLEEAVDLHGTLDTRGRLSDTTSGLKSVVVKLITPFYKKKHSSLKEVPFKITGKYGNANIGLDWRR